MLLFNKDFMRYFSLLGFLGFVMIGNIGFFLFINYLIGRCLYKSDALFLLFLIIGIISGFYNCYRLIMKK